MYYTYAAYRTNNPEEVTIVVSSAAIVGPFPYDEKYAVPGSLVVFDSLEALDEAVAELENEKGLLVTIDASAVKTGNIYRMVSLGFQLLIGMAAGFGVISLIANMLG